MSVLRPITPADHADVLALNEDQVELLAPLSRERLEELLAWADRAEVIDVDGGFAGFVLTFVSGSAYDGENFAWFGERLEDYCYLDRVVVHPAYQRRGLATRVYDELESTCRRRVFALEVNLDPPNEASLAFHRSRGFVDVGARESGGHTVTMMTKDLT